MINTLAVDPGLRGIGLAYFIGPKLSYANYVKNPVERGDGPKAWFAMADATHELLTRLKLPVNNYVVELMQIYRFSKGNPNVLLPLAAVSAAVGAAFPVTRAVGYYPREWKGQVKKEIHHPRILAALAPNEHIAIAESRKTYVGHVIDAIGLGLYDLERTGVRRWVAPGTPAAAI